MADFYETCQFATFNGKARALSASYNNLFDHRVNLTRDQLARFFVYSLLMECHREAGESCSCGRYERSDGQSAWCVNINCDGSQIFFLWWWWLSENRLKTLNGVGPLGFWQGGAQIEIHNHCVWLPTPGVQQSPWSTHRMKCWFVMDLKSFRDKPDRLGFEALETVNKKSWRNYKCGAPFQNDMSGVFFIFSCK